MSNLDEISRAIGALQASQKAMQSALNQVQKDVSKMQATLSEARGGWKTLLLVAGAAGTIGAFVGKFLPWFHK